MGATVSKGQLFFSTMHSEGLAGKTETFLRYGVSSRLEVGFGYLWKQGIVRPLASYTLITEKEQRPSFTAGLMYDSLGGGRQGAFLSAAKSFRKTPLGVPVSVYVGGAQISGEDHPRLIAGLNASLTQRVTASLQYDGKYPNVGLTTQIAVISGAPIRVGIVAAQGDHFGPLIATTFPLPR